MSEALGEPETTATGLPTPPMLPNFAVDLTVDPEGDMILFRSVERAESRRDLRGRVDPAKRLLLTS